MYSQAWCQEKKIEGKITMSFLISLNEYVALIPWNCFSEVILRSKLVYA